MYFSVVYFFKTNANILLIFIGYLETLQIYYVESFQYSLKGVDRIRPALKNTIPFSYGNEDLKIMNRMQSGKA